MNIKTLLICLAVLAVITGTFVVVKCDLFTGGTIQETTEKLACEWPRDPAICESNFNGGLYTVGWEVCGACWALHNQCEAEENLRKLVKEAKELLNK